MHESTFDRLALAAGVVASLAVGVPMAGFALTGGGPVTGPGAVGWWVAYLVHLGTFLLMGTERRPVPVGDRPLLAAQVVAAAVAFAIVPELGWTSVLFVINAVSAAFVLPLRGAVAVVAGQALLAAATTAISGVPAFDVVLGAIVYAGFQGFALLAVLSERRQRETSAALAATNAELRATTALLAESSRTAERLRIARELHDLVGHQLTALALELEVAGRKAEPPGDEHVVRARGIAKDLLRDVRAAVGDLRAPVPGLRTALEAMAATYGDLTVQVEVHGDLNLDEASATALLRCAQEAVTNAARHAAAANIWIAVRRDGDDVALRAHDDGRGVAVLRPGNGLRGMRERLEALGGGIDIDPAAGRGFSLTARVPAS